MNTRITLDLSSEESKMWELFKDMLQQEDDSKAFALLLRKTYFDSKLAQSISHLTFILRSPEEIPLKFRRDARTLADKLSDKKPLGEKIEDERCPE